MVVTEVLERGEFGHLSVRGQRGPAPAGASREMGRIWATEEVPVGERDEGRGEAVTSQMRRLPDLAVAFDGQRMRDVASVQGAALVTFGIGANRYDRFGSVVSRLLIEQLAEVKVQEFAWVGDGEFA